MNMKEFTRRWNEVTHEGAKLVVFGRNSFIYADRYYSNAGASNHVGLVCQGVFSGVISLSRIKRVI